MRIVPAATAGPVVGATTFATPAATTIRRHHVNAALVGPPRRALHGQLHSD